MKEEAERLKTMNEQRANYKKQVEMLEAELQTLREGVREKTVALEVTKDDLNKRTKGYGEASTRLTKELKDNEDKEKKIRSLTEKNASLTRKAERARAKVVAAEALVVAAAAQPPPEVVVDRVLETELRLLKQRVRCSVCSDRDKSVVITKCFHLFCGPCIDSNLKVRLRKSQDVGCHSGSKTSTRFT
jgi:E3 ubiquitin-protein ligase BRE1